MKRFNLKSYIAGAMTMLLLFSPTLVSAETRQSIDAVFGKVKLIINGEPIDKETLLYDGTTYIPLRAAAEALGKEVSYDEASSAAYIDEKGTNRTFGAPDYSLKENWAYFGVGGTDKAADLFLLCPTVYMGGINLFNMPIDDTNKQRFVRALNMERGMYEESCRMYAPYYRQVGLNVYIFDEAISDKYFDLAYEDVRNAFKAYMENHNNGRPFILAGFSQGSDMALRLMKEFFADEDTAKLCVASYLIGWRVTEEDIEAHPYIKMAQEETDTGVIISFNTEAEDVEYSIVVPEKTLGINPLNWKTDSTPASREYNKGACFTNNEGGINTEIPNMTGAYLDPSRGTLKVTDINAEDYPSVLDLFGRGVYHLYDYQFFYRNLQENVEDRVRSYMSGAK